MARPETSIMRSAERTMIVVRTAAVVFALLQVQTYYLPYPDGFRAYGFAVAALLAVGNLAIWLVYRNTRSAAGVQRLSIAAFAFDFAIVFLFVSVYTFDVNTAIFILIYMLPLEGAIRFGRKGALVAMAGATLVYTVREFVGAHQYGYDFLPTSITFRMGIGFMVAIVAGEMSDRYAAERKRVEDLYHHEHEAVEALRTLDEIKNTFLTAVSHELRTPLTSVMGFAMTLSSMAEELTPQHKEMLDHVSVQAARLSHLLNDLLDVQRITSPLERETCDLGSIVQHAVEQIEPLTEGRPIQLEVEPVVISVDGPKIERIVENLILNAIKYTPDDSPIHVFVRTHEDGAIILVEDEGPGVPAQLREVVFQPFRRGAQHSQHAPGAGIGLSLVARFTQMHGGRAWVEESATGGASFRVVLPERG